MSSIISIKNKLERGLALTGKESWDLAVYIEKLEKGEDLYKMGYLDGVSNYIEILLKIKNKKESEEENDRLLGVLDKIRAEITDWQTDIHDNEYDAEIHDFVFERIYEILDEYKAESEERNG